MKSYKELLEDDYEGTIEIIASRWKLGMEDLSEGGLEEFLDLVDTHTPIVEKIIENTIFDFTNDYLLYASPESLIYRLYHNKNIYICKVVFQVEVFSMEMMGYSLMKQGLRTGKYTGNLYLAQYENNVGVIIYDHLGISLDKIVITNEIRSMVMKLLEDMDYDKICHNDLHPGNITIKDGKLYVIDYTEVVSSDRLCIDIKKRLEFLKDLI